MFWIATYRNSNNKESTDAAGWISKWTVVKARWQPEIYWTLGAMRLGGCGLYMMFDNVFASRTMCLTLITRVFLEQTLFFSPAVLSPQQASTSCCFSIKHTRNLKPAGFHLSLPGSFSTTTGHHIPTPRPYFDTLCIYKIAISQEGAKRQAFGSVCRLRMSAEMKREEFPVAEKLDYICFSGAAAPPGVQIRRTFRIFEINFSVFFSSRGN